MSTFTLSPFEQNKRQAVRLVREAYEKLSAVRDYLGDLSTDDSAGYPPRLRSVDDASDIRAQLLALEDNILALVPGPVRTHERAVLASNAMNSVFTREEAKLSAHAREFLAGKGFAHAARRALEAGELDVSAELERASAAVERVRRVLAHGADMELRAPDEERTDWTAEDEAAVEQALEGGDPLPTRTAPIGVTRDPLPGDIGDARPAVRERRDPHACRECGGVTSHKLGCGRGGRSS